MAGKYFLIGVLATAMVSAAGCQAPDSGVTDWRRSLTTEVVGVRTFIPSEPWRSFDPEGDPDPEGLVVTVYLESAIKAKGVFGDGDFQFRLYRVTHKPGGKRETEQVHEWTFNPEQARPWQLKKPTAYGCGYQFPLNWGALDVYGRDVELQARFVTRDGKMLVGRRHNLKVPLRR